MQLEKLAILFSNEISRWPVSSPSKILPFYIRSYLKNTWGKSFCVNDFNKKQSPNRFGLLTRNFQPGDSLKTLSLPLLVRSNLLMTKMDVTAGQKNVLVLFHKYFNMTYFSEFSSVNKGQLANGICAILEDMHKSIGHKFIIKALHGKEFFENCKQYEKNFRDFDKIYFISDFLFNTNSIEACGLEVKKTIEYYNLKNSSFIIVRDPLEYTKLQLKTQNNELSPWDIDTESDLRETKIRKLILDENYTLRVKMQLNHVEENISQSQNNFIVMTPMHLMSELFKFIGKI